MLFVRVLTQLGSHWEEGQRERCEMAVRRSAFCPCSHLVQRRLVRTGKRGRENVVKWPFVRVLFVRVLTQLGSHWEEGQRERCELHVEKKFCRYRGGV